MNFTAVTKNNEIKLTLISCDHIILYNHHLQSMNFTAVTKNNEIKGGRVV